VSARTNPRSFAHRSAVLWGGRMSVVAAMLGIQLYYSNALTPATFGRYNGLFVQIGFWSALLPLGLPYVITLAPQQTAGALMRRLALRGAPVFAALLVATAVASHRYFAGLPEAATPTAQALLVACIVVLAALLGTSVLLESMLLRAGGDYPTAIAQIIYAAGLVTVHFVYLPTTGVVALLVGWTAVALIRLAFLFWHARGHPRQPVTPTVVASATRQWAWLGANEAIETSVRYLDKLVLLTLISEGTFAVYMLGTYELPLLAVLVSVSGLLFNAGAAGGDFADPYRAFGRNALLLAAFVFPLAGVLIACAEALFALPLFRGRYADAAPLFRLAALIIPVRIANHASLLQLKSRNNLILAGTLLSLVVYFALLWPLYHWFGLAGVVWTNIISTYLQTAFYWWHSARLWKRPMGSLLPFGALLQMLGISAVLAAIPFTCWKMSNSWTVLGIGALVFAAAVTVNVRFIYQHYAR